MHRSITAAATAVAAAAAALVLATPAAAQAATTKFEFHNVTFSDGQTGTIYASTKTNPNKVDNVFCDYATSEGQSLGQYEEFVEPAPSNAQDVRDFCLAHFDERQ